MVIEVFINHSLDIKYERDDYPNIGNISSQKIVPDVALSLPSLPWPNVSLTLKKDGKYKKFASHGADGWNFVEIEL
jgi:hypothetical protein